MYQPCSVHAGLLSGRDVSGGQLAEVLWFPNAGYALFPLYIPGKPSIPRESLQASVLLVTWLQTLLGRMGGALASALVRSWLCRVQI